MEELTEIFEHSLPMFVAMCLAGMALWKIRPSSSPLWMPVIVSIGLYVLRANDDVFGSDDIASIAAAGIAAFVYLDWRSVHRPRPIPWTRRSILIIVGASIACAVLIAAAVAVRNHRQHAREGAAEID